MQLNCEPNDVAMVVRSSTGHPCVAFEIGRPLIVRSAFISPTGPAWFCDGLPAKCPHCGGTVAAYHDADLQPLRPITAETGWAGAVEEMDDMGRYCDSDSFKPSRNSNQIRLGATDAGQ